MTKLIDRVNLPNEVGFFLARTSGSEWWNLIVMVYGVSPFFKADVWNYNNNMLSINANIFEIEEFGPKLSDYPVQEIKRTTKEWNALYGRN